MAIRNGLMLGICFFLVCFAQTCEAEYRPFPPPLPHGDPSLSLFLERLEQAVDERDQAFILSLVHEDCAVSYGGFRGRDDFRHYWFGSVSHGRDFFTELRAALELGGILTEQGNAFVIPYTTTAPGMSEQGIMLSVLARSKVCVHAYPGLQGRVLTTLGHELVSLCNIEVPILVDGMDWTCILLPDGGRGYVATKFLASPLAQRFLFRRIDGNWRLVSTVAGQ